MSRRLALIIANSTYDHEGLSRLRSPAADAEALAEVLGDRRVSEFSVQVVRDETASVVQERVEDLFLEGEPDDVLLLHFSCHGVKSESGELFFAARNTRPNRLGSTAVPADFVRRCMRQSRSRSIVLLLDCCYGGAFGEGVAVRAAGDVDVLSTLSGGRGRAVITASSAMEYAFEGDHLAEDHAPEPSVFTSALVRGLSTGEADRDEDGLISLNELYDYVFERVRQENPNQTPSRDIEMQGELYLARSGRRRIKPAAMPADLAAAVADSNMFTRLGAVAELRSRLSSGNLEVAAGAHLALTQMASTDISSVAGAAAAALSDAMIQPSVSVLRFSTPGPHAVVLGGPPLARAVTVTASEPWIRVALVEDEIQVSLQQAAPESEGRIEISGPTGNAVVSVLSEAVETPSAARQASMSRPVVPGPPMPTGPATSAGQSEQAGQRKPVEEPPKRSRPDTDALVPRTAVAVLGAAALLLLAVPSDYRYDDAMLVNRPTLWAYFVSLGLAALVGGLALLRPRARTAGAGVLVAAGSLALAGLALLLFEPIYSESFAPYGVAYYMGAVAMLLLIGSALAAVKIVRRVPGASFAESTPPWYSVVLILCGLAVSAVLVWRASLLSTDDLVWIAGSYGAALGAPVVPWLAARARPAHLAGGLVAVWAVLLVVLSAMPFGFTTTSFLIILPVLVVVGLTAARRQLR
ncbi:caspase family protein [Lentzea sp. NPDC006480]|uniref:caspase family protein n=1 Tax=Lentzea sp. NPDC006480 TaxID=3157176 RepID=UPI0033A22934